MYKHIIFDFTKISPGLHNNLAALVEHTKPYELECHFETIGGERCIVPEQSLVVDDIIAHIGVCSSLRGAMYQAMLFEVNRRYSELVDDDSEVNGDY